MKTILSHANLIDCVEPHLEGDREFADSPLEGDGFEPSVPHKKQPFLAAPVRFRNSLSATKTGSLEPCRAGGRKSIMASRSFGRAVTTVAELREAVASYAARAAEKLRRQRLATTHLMVFVETNRFKPDEGQHHAARTVHLPVATSDSGKLIGAALAGLASIGRKGYRSKKAGVVLLDLHPAAVVQEGLFDKAENPRRAALMRTVDRLNLRFGRDTVSFAAAGIRRPWKLRREFLSPCYTTAWDELLRV
jgi:DNA polymerase V